MSNIQKRLDVRIIGDDDDIMEILTFLGCVQHIGDNSLIRDIKMTVDGEVTGKMKFQLKVADNQEWIDMPSVEDDGDEIEFVIGD